MPKIDRLLRANPWDRLLHAVPWGHLLRVVPSLPLPLSGREPVAYRHDW